MTGDCAESRNTATLNCGSQTPTHRLRLPRALAPRKQFLWVAAPKRICPSNILTLLSVVIMHLFDREWTRLAATRHVCWALNSLTNNTYISRRGSATNPAEAGKALPRSLSLSSRQEMGRKKRGKKGMRRGEWRILHPEKKKSAPPTHAVSKRVCDVSCSERSSWCQTRSLAEHSRYCIASTHTL